MKNYELMFIVKPTIEDEAANAICESMKKTLEDMGAKILEVKNLGHKELAYEINDHKSGYYYLYEISSKDDKAEKEFNRLANLSEDIIRHIIIKL